MKAILILVAIIGLVSGAVGVINSQTEVSNWEFPQECRHCDGSFKYKFENGFYIGRCPCGDSVNPPEKYWPN